MKILKLDVDALNDDFFEDTKLLGIIAPTEKHLFCWQLNNVLGFEFKLSNEIEIPIIKKKRNYYYAIYQSPESGSSLVHLLYHNHCDGEYLLPEFKHMDFLWLMKGDLIEEDRYLWIKLGIKQLPVVQLVTELTNEKIINKGNLVF